MHDVSGRMQLGSGVGQWKSLAPAREAVAACATKAYNSAGLIRPAWRGGEKVMMRPHLGIVHDDVVRPAARGPGQPDARRAYIKAPRRGWNRAPASDPSRETSSSLPASDAAADQQRYGFQLKTGQIQETIKLAAHSATTHIIVATAIWWLWEGKPLAFLIPFWLMVVLTEIVVLVGRSVFENAEPTPRVVDLAHRCAEVIALVQGLTWGSVPVVLLRGIDPDHLVLLVGISTGLIGGVFVFGTISRISIIYMVPLVSGNFLGLAIEPLTTSVRLAVLLGIFGFFVLFCVIRLNGLATRRILDRLRVDDQRETISLLLNDFEENTSDWLWETDERGRLIHVSDRMAQAALLSPSQLLHRAFDEIFDTDLIGQSTLEQGRKLKFAMEARIPFRDLIITFERDEVRHWWSLSGKPLFAGSGGFRGVGSDITATMLAQERVAYLAAHDVLTGLTNRVLFRDLLAAAIDMGGATGMAVLYVDLDDFKVVNDTFGHSVGDNVLRHVADRLRAAVPADATVARLGGDEFAVLLRQIGDDAAIALAKIVIDSLGEPCQCDGVTVPMGVSIGIAVGTIDARDPETLLHRADLALYEAKSHGKAQVVCFEAAFETTVGARLALQADIKHAIARNEMRVFYQPIVSSQSREVVACEALLRWTCPQRGRVSPADFIAAAEACGAIVAIGAWTLQQACIEANRWPEHIRIAVNLSPVQCRSSDLIDVVKDALALSNLAPRRLELEITESVLLVSNLAVKRNITELKQLGVRFALDDFGTGFSSLSYLLKFPFDKIKIDRCFVKDLSARLECEAVVDAVLGLAKRLGATVTAEGVETEEQAAYLASRSCDQLQGFLFSPAVPADEFDGLLRRGFADGDIEVISTGNTSHELPSYRVRHIDRALPAALELSLT